MSYRVTIKPSDHSFSAPEDETILHSALEAGFNLPYGCRNGACGACKGKVVEGSIDHGNYQAGALTDTEKQAGMALFCCAHPLSDVVIESREVTAADAIQPRIMLCRVQKKQRLSHDVMLLLLKLPNNERMQFLAGQYVDFLLKDGKRRAFSLANAPHSDDLLEVHLRLIPGGQFTEYVFNEMPEKAIMRLEGPFGNFYLREDSDRPIIFIAAGICFAPIKSIIEHALHHGIKRQMILYWGARTLQDLYMQELPLQWQQAHPNFSYIPVLSEPLPEDAWQGRSGLVHQAVLEDHADLSSYQVYCCGVPQMVDRAHKEFQGHGLSELEFFSDVFAFSNSAPGAVVPQ